MNSRVLKLSSLIGAGLMLSACGASKAKIPEGPKAVFTSSADCADTGPLPYQKCDAAISKAIAEHDTNGPTYRSVRRCENAEGSDKCDRTVNGKYRPRVVAFLVTTGEQPTAKALYPTTDGEEGLRDGDAKIYTMDGDEEIAFSRSAMHAYDLYWSAKKRKRKKKR